MSPSLRPVVQEALIRLWPRSRNGTLIAVGCHFKVPVEHLLGEEPAATKRGPAPKLQRQMEQVATLPKAQQQFVSQFLDTVLKQAM